MNIEYQICTTYVTWARRMTGVFPELELLHHVANEGKRAAWTAGRMGIVAGMPDYNMPVARGKWIGFWLEIKAPGKKPTKTQEAMMRKLSNTGHFVRWVDTAQKAIDLTTDYLRCDKMEVSK